MRTTGHIKVCIYRFETFLRHPIDNFRIIVQCFENNSPTKICIRMFQSSSTLSFP
jgi:hypothetical protein